MITIQRVSSSLNMKLLLQDMGQSDDSNNNGDKMHMPQTLVENVLDMSLGCRHVLKLQG